MVCPINQMTAVPQELADLIGSRICGPSCVAMALQILDKYPLFEKENELGWLLASLADLHRSDVEMIYYRAEIFGVNIDIPVDTLSENNKYLLKEPGFVKKKPGKEYKPIFSLVRGYDHRGSERLFSKYGLRAGFWEKLEMNELISKMNEGALALLSVTPRRPAKRNLVISKCEPTQSHVVLVSKMDNRGGRKFFEIMDPAYDINQGLEPRYELNEEELIERLNWRGSWVASSG